MPYFTEAIEQAVVAAGRDTEPVSRANVWKERAEFYTSALPRTAEEETHMLQAALEESQRQQQEMMKFWAAAAATRRDAELELESFEALEIRDQHKTAESADEVHLLLMDQEPASPPLTPPDFILSDSDKELTGDGCLKLQCRNRPGLGIESSLLSQLDCIARSPHICRGSGANVGMRASGTAASQTSFTTMPLLPPHWQEQLPTRNTGTVDSRTPVFTSVPIDSSQPQRALVSHAMQPFTSAETIAGGTATVNSPQQAGKPTQRIFHNFNAEGTAVTTAKTSFNDVPRDPNQLLPTATTAKHAAKEKSFSQMQQALQPDSPAAAKVFDTASKSGRKLHPDLHPQEIITKIPVVNSRPSSALPENSFQPSQQAQASEQEQRKEGNIAPKVRDFPVATASFVQQPEAEKMPPGFPSLLNADQSNKYRKDLPAPHAAQIPGMVSSTDAKPIGLVPAVQGSRFGKQPESVENPNVGNIKTQPTTTVRIEPSSPTVPSTEVTTEATKSDTSNAENPRDDNEATRLNTPRLPFQPGFPTPWPMPMPPFPSGTMPYPFYPPPWSYYPPMPMMPVMPHPMMPMVPMPYWIPPAMHPAMQPRPQIPQPLNPEMKPNEMPSSNDQVTEKTESGASEASP